MKHLLEYSRMNSGDTDKKLSLDQVEALVAQEHDYTWPDITPDERVALDTFDQLACGQDALQCEALPLVGLVAGLKPASIFSDDLEVRKVLDSFHIPYSIFERVDGDLLFASRSIDIMRATYDVYVQYYRSLGGDGSEYDRMLGRLLGYPQTSTEYFIQRSKSLRSSSSHPLPCVMPVSFIELNKEHFLQIVLSNQHWQEEVEMYVQPLEEAYGKLLPLMYRQVRSGVNKAYTGHIAYKLVDL